MENLIDLRAGADLERKYFTAFLKGLASIKYRALFAKLAASQHEEEPDVMQLDFLYGNLFDPTITTADTFNQLVEAGLRLLAELLELNVARG